MESKQTNLATNQDSSSGCRMKETLRDVDQTLNFFPKEPKRDEIQKENLD